MGTPSYEGKQVYIERALTRPLIATLSRHARKRLRRVYVHARDA